MLRKTKNSIEFVQNKGVNPVYVARQAILDVNKQVVAYELLFRNNNIQAIESIKLAKYFGY